MTTPYENATSGIAARDEITKLLRRFGCEHFATAAGRCSCAPARKAGLRCTWKSVHTATGFAFNAREGASRARAGAETGRDQQLLRHWVKGKVMAIETGILSFDAVFLPFMLTHDGRTVSDRADQLGMLEAPA